MKQNTAQRRSIMAAISPSQFFLMAMLIFITSVKSTLIKERPFNKIYAFGDSFTDTGNTHSSSGPTNFMHVSSPPYGQTFFHHPTNRYSDGRLVIDFVTQSLSLPFIPPYQNPKADKSNGVNFAVAGSTAIGHSFFVKNNMTLNRTPQSLGTELIWFNRFLESKGCKNFSTTPRECGSDFKDALIWFGEIGVNDYAYSIGSSVSTDTIQQLAINTVNGFLKEILNKGAKYVIVQGLPPTGCLTLTMALAPENDRDEMGCVASANKLSYNHNTKLLARLNKLRNQFPKAVILYADYWNAYATILKNASKYGFKELFRACCGSSGDNGSSYNFNPFETCGSLLSKTCSNTAQYINWDGVHLTEAMYNAVSNGFIKGNFCDPTFESLIRDKVRSG